MQQTYGKKCQLTALFLIIVLGAILRIHKLGAESIWLDEGYSVVISKLSFMKVATFVDDFPPLYYVVLHGWMRLFGDSEFSIRFPSLIFGVLSIGLIYQVGLLLFDERKGLIAALLLALSTFHIHYSQDARPYSLTVFLALLSIYAFIKCLQQWDLYNSIGYVAASALLLYSHVIGLFLIAAQNLYIISLYLFFKEDKTIPLERWLILQASIGLIFCPWLPTFMRRAFSHDRAAWLQTPNLKDIDNTLRAYAGSNLLKLCVPLALASIVTMKAINSTGGWRSLLRSFEPYKPGIIIGDIKQNWLLLLCASMPIVMPYLLSFIITPLYSSKYTIIGSISFYLLIASGIGNLRTAAMRVLVIAVFMVVSSINTVDYYHSTTNRPWREVEQYIEQNSRPEDMLIIDSKHQYDKTYKYYSKSNKIQTIATPPISERIDTDLLQQWSALAKGRHRIWVVLTKDFDKSNPIIQTLQRTHKQVDIIQYRRIRLYLFQLRDKVQSNGHLTWDCSNQLARR
jgi:mannosyltransferase